MAVLVFAALLAFFLPLLSTPRYDTVHHCTVQYLLAVRRYSQYSIIPRYSSSRSTPVDLVRKLSVMCMYILHTHVYMYTQYRIRIMPTHRIFNLESHRRRRDEMAIPRSDRHSVSRLLPYSVLRPVRYCAVLYCTSTALATFADRVALPRLFLPCDRDKGPAERREPAPKKQAGNARWLISVPFSFCGLSHAHRQHVEPSAIAHPPAGSQASSPTLSPPPPPQSK